MGEFEPGQEGSEGWKAPDSEADIHSDREHAESTEPEKYPEPSPEE